MRTFKIITLSILAIILPFFVKGTPQAASQDNASNSSGAKKTFTVGMIVPLSGPLAFFGQDYMRAYELAVAKRPELRTDESVSILIDAPPGTADLRTEVLKLRDAKFDALGVYLLPDSHHGFINALRSIPKKPFLFGVEELIHPENNRGNEDLVEGALVIAPWVSPQYQDLFESKHGSSAGFFDTAAFYDFFNLVADTVKANSAARGLNLI